MPKLNPKIAGWWNVVLCSGLVVFAIVRALTGYPSFLFLLIVAIPMDVFFIRRLVKAYQVPAAPSEAPAENS
jgi:hypothetical protein